MVLNNNLKYLFNVVMHAIRWIVLIIIGTLPPTRFYATKVKILRLSGIKIGVGARVVSSAKFWGMNIFIGENTFVGHEVLITNGDAIISIGANVDIAPRVLIVSGTHEITPWANRTAGKGFSKDIHIEDGCWIGAGAIILGGVTIGENAMVGAGSLVCTDVMKGAIVVGNPAKTLKIWNYEKACWDTVAPVAD